MTSEALSEIQVGPVLRGLSAVTAVSAAELAGGTLRAGGQFRYIPAGSDSAGGSAADGNPLLRLPSLDSIDAIVGPWSDFVANYGGGPAVVELPSGASWRRTAPAQTPPPPAAPTDSAPSRSSRPAELLTPGDLAGSVTGRVAIVTGAAQGFGLQIARGLASLGAVVAFADMNIDGAREQATALGAPHSAFAVNVTDEESVAELVTAVTREYGGFDLVVSNAGVLKAGSVKELALKDFRFVTDVNYIGFFLMTKHTAPVLELQNRAAVQLQTTRTAEGGSDAAQTNAHGATGNSATRGDVPARPVPYLTDIVEINSKSGLVGSNKNAAYAGSKFGGIGLVQSFALELVEQGTKVNAICPGNYLDGPLWSDPERGLFVQYLRAGKVPGATTVEEVRRFYEDKVPMKRGCTGADVVRALAYVVGQPYETGQAVPVTGGQVMLA